MALNISPIFSFLEMPDLRQRILQCLVCSFNLVYNYGVAKTVFCVFLVLISVWILLSPFVNICQFLLFFFFFYKVCKIGFGALLLPLVSFLSNPQFYMPQ
jgi:hypothetical protein